VPKRARQGEDGTAVGRDPQRGYQEQSTGEVVYDCISVHITVRDKAINPLVFAVWHCQGEVLTGWQ